VVFETGIDNADRHQLIAVAESLSYRQLVTLAVYASHRPGGVTRVELSGRPSRT
jgi:hypothetical protein